MRSYSLEILATDHAVAQRSGAVEVYIDVTDANDNAPIFVGTNHTLFLQVRAMIPTVSSGGTHE